MNVWKTKNEMKREEVRMKNAVNNELDLKWHRKLIMKMIVYLVTLKKSSRVEVICIINYKYY